MTHSPHQKKKKSPLLTLHRFSSNAAACSNHPNLAGPQIHILIIPSFASPPASCLPSALSFPRFAATPIRGIHRLRGKAAVDRRGTVRKRCLVGSVSWVAVLLVHEKTALDAFLERVAIGRRVA